MIGMLLCSCSIQMKVLDSCIVKGRTSFESCSTFVRYLLRLLDDHSLCTVWAVLHPRLSTYLKILRPVHD